MSDDKKLVNELLVLNATAEKQDKTEADRLRTIEKRAELHRKILDRREQK